MGAAPIPGAREAQTRGGASRDLQIMVACTYEHMNATYDLSPLLKIGGAYHVSDEYDGAHSTRNYTYAMNVCGAVDPRELPASCADKGEGNAWQVSSDDAYCYRLGATATAFSPLDATDPSRGVRLTYAAFLR